MATRIQVGRSASHGEVGQLELPFRRHGGARVGAGRKPRPERVGLLPHLTRERHRAYQPVHVTARAVRSAPNLRSEVVFAALRALFARSSEKGFRLLHFSVQGNHLHLIAEGDDGLAFARGIQRLLSRAGPSILAPPATWLARRGWKPHGLLRFDEVPRPRRPHSVR
jgi:REP element-mobilizing transposase RayT